MTPFEMEEQLKDLHVRTVAIEQILPTLATRQDLRDEVAKLATKDEFRSLSADVHSLREDVRLTTAALQHQIQSALQEAKGHANRLNERTTEQIRMLAGQLTLHTMATREDLQALRDDIHALSKQIAKLSVRRGRK